MRPYVVITRTAFDLAARGYIRRDRHDTAYAWIQQRERDGHRFVSVQSAVHAWMAHQLTKRR